MASKQPQISDLTSDLKYMAQTTPWSTETFQGSPTTHAAMFVRTVLAIFFYLGEKMKKKATYLSEIK